MDIILSNADSKFEVSSIDDYLKLIERLHGSIVKTFNKLQLEDYTKKTISDSKQLLSNSNKLLKQLKQHTKTLETLMSDCVDFIEEITEDLSEPPKEEDFVFNSAGGMLSYIGRDYIPKTTMAEHLSKLANNTNHIVPTTPILPIIPAKPVLSNPVIERILIPELGYYLKLPTVTDLKQIPLALYYLKPNKDSTQVPGIYMNLAQGNYVRIPFPEVVDSKKEYDRKHSIRCKYNSKQECDTQRSKMAKIYNSTVRVCNFAHNGETIVKIGYPSRCPSVPNYGNPTTMANDIKQINFNDVKNTLLYGLNDLISSIVWLDYNTATNLVMDKLEQA